MFQLPPLRIKRKLVFDEDDDTEIEEDVSEKRRKVNEEEKEAQLKFDQWMKEYKAKQKKGKDSDIICLDDNDGKTVASSSHLVNSQDARLNVFPVKLENLKLSDISIEVRVVIKDNSTWCHFSLA